MIRRVPLRTALAAVLMLTVPASAEPKKPVQDAWALFKTTCTAIMAEDIPAKIQAAFAPFEAQVASTPDGAVVAGNAEITGAQERFGVKYALFFYSAHRLEGGSIRSCSMQMHTNDQAFIGLPAVAQTNAESLLGADFAVQGGPILSADGLEGASIVLTSPGFPPERTLTALSEGRVASLMISTMIPD